MKTYHHYNDPELIALWQQGDEKAFDCLYKRYVVYLINIAAQKTDSLDTAKELVQDVFLSVYQRRDELHTTSSLKSFLYVALKNKIFNHYRNLFSKWKHERNASNQLRVVTNNLHDEYEAKELELQLHEIIQELPPQCRKVFLMSREEQLSHKEIAERLNISPNTVDQHIQKALRILRSSAGGVLMVVWWMRGW
ncbi:MAG TPA: RNA polymerase sigma-70 factor [Chitinophagaceae bacterium]|nr:RNA polymerase sigma-70 factor [Chitinophagaceae bacterium]